MIKIVHRHQKGIFVLTIWELPPYAEAKYRAVVTETNGVRFDKPTKYLKEFLHKNYLDVAYLGYYELQSRYSEYIASDEVESFQTNF